jgi:HAD superfamily hydrolase (TIGR01509 family)
MTDHHRPPFARDHAIAPPRTIGSPLGGDHAIAPPGALQAVLWDMDGTLVDTEPYWIEAEYALVAEFGGTWTEEDSRRLIGNALMTSAEYIRDVGGVDLPLVDIVHRLQGHVIDQVNRAANWQPGARELLAGLRAAGVPQALVTMSWTPLAQAVLKHLPEGTFDIVVTGDQVRNGKPHPEPYTTAARLLGVEPAACVAIEDSPTGIASAEAAGAVTFAVPHLMPIPRAPGRTVVESLTDLDVGVLAQAVEERWASVSEP